MIHKPNSDYSKWDIAVDFILFLNKPSLDTAILKLYCSSGTLILLIWFREEASRIFCTRNNTKCPKKNANYFITKSVLLLVLAPCQFWKPETHRPPVASLIQEQLSFTTDSTPGTCFRDEVITETETDHLHKFRALTVHKNKPTPIASKLLQKLESNEFRSNEKKNHNIKWHQCPRRCRRRSRRRCLVGSASN